jgi:twitching motility protein PilJ
VTADMTGAIADSFNIMIEELRRIIGRVQNTTATVSHTANEIRATTEHLALGSQQQTTQILSTSKAIDEMAASINRVSENAGQCARVAEEARGSAIQGAEAVSRTLDGMRSIRDQVQETSKRIKRLGENSQEIGEIVQLISDIADRTSILALNASIQAAMAGEAGRGFSVVAGEVERLAERATEATKQVATLVKTTQAETAEAASAMEATTKEVVGGSKLAAEANEALAGIRRVSDRLAELIEAISAAAGNQARGSEGLARAMTGISAITQDTASGVKKAAASTIDLVGFADELRASLDRFRLPETTRAV